MNTSHQYYGYHPHVFTLVSQMPKSFHPNQPHALIEYEYIAGSPESYDKPDDVDSISILRIAIEGHYNVTPDTLSRSVVDELIAEAFKNIDSSEEIDSSKGEHQIW